MKPHNPPPDDQRLRALLRAARPAAELPPGFSAAVWRRIERHEATAAGSWFERLAPWLLRPQWAAASLALVLLSGALLGARHTPAPERLTAQARYVAAVNPFQPRP